MIALRVAALAAVAVLSACGGGARHCTGEFEYQKAQTLPPPGAVDGLSVPQSPSALQIPPAPKAPVGFANQVQDEGGNLRTECLDMPPRMRATEEPPEAVIGSPAAPTPAAEAAPKAE
ncbi:MAG: hypothetical protein M3O62_15840 [Pseudomonadota bacterium]|nr:hypothetical protein [Pseudomonadota bacterium]